ncbi:MAG: hypothetical protein IKO32_02340 [Lachnospiraceae bacterium]|nr:hypothetical protein [Lachnospiraceae bacterium]
MKCRFRCGCGNVFNGDEHTQVCSSCGRPLDVANCGAIQLYRMGNMMGMAVGMGVYIDDIPFGHLANKESARFVVPYGSHKIHVTHTSTRACNDPIVTITPEQPVAFMKAHFAAMGFKIAVEPARPEEMPPV